MKKKPQWDDRRGTFVMLSNFIPTWWTTHKVKNIYITEVLPWSESSELHMSGSLAWVWHWVEKPPEHLTVKARSSTGLGETEIPLLAGTHKVLHALEHNKAVIT